MAVLSSPASRPFVVLFVVPGKVIGRGFGRAGGTVARIVSMLRVPLLAMLLSAGPAAAMDPVDAAIDDGASWLSNLQHEDGAFTLDGERLFRIWETANAVRTLGRLDPDRSAVRRGRRYLARERAGVGGLYYRPRDDPHAYDIEVSAVAALAFPRLHPEAVALRRFIARQQRDDGAWSIGDPYPPIERRHRLFPSATCFALRALAFSDRGDPAAGLAYVRRRQRMDGSWGRRWQFYGTVYYPMYACLPILVGDASRTARGAALDFLQSNQREDGAWHDGGPGPSTAMRSALALSAALAGGASVSDVWVDRGVKWLLAAQAEDGRWHGGHFPRHPGKSGDLFATAVAIEALVEYRDRVAAARTGESD